MNVPDSVIQFIEEEVRQANIEFNTLTGEMLEAQDKKAKLTGWRDARERCKKRIQRMERFLAELRAGGQS